MGNEHFEAFKRAYLRGNEAIQRGDVETAWGGVPADFELFPPPDAPEPAPRRGPEEIIAFLHDLRKQIPDWSGEVVEFIDAGDGTYVVHLELEGTSRAAGLPAALTLFQVWETKDGVPTRAREFTDRNQALEAAELK